MIIGIEGVSCTGKTTLASALASDMNNPLVVPCYYHSAPDPAKLPRPVADGLDEQLESLTALLEVEQLSGRLRKSLGGYAASSSTAG